MAERHGGGSAPDFHGIPYKVHRGHLNLGTVCRGPGPSQGPIGQDWFFLAARWVRASKCWSISSVLMTRASDSPIMP